MVDSSQNPRRNGLTCFEELWEDERRLLQTDKLILNGCEILVSALELTHDT